MGMFQQLSAGNAGSSWSGTVLTPCGATQPEITLHIRIFSISGKTPIPQAKAEYTKLQQVLGFSIGVKACLRCVRIAPNSHPWRPSPIRQTPLNNQIFLHDG
jgi:hypothetical protein